MAQTQHQKKTGSKQYSLGRIDDIEIAQLYCEDFENLDENEKKLAYWLYRAALAGREIAIDQSNPGSLQAQKTLKLILNSENVVDSIKLKIKDYLKKIWVHNGIYHDKTHQKITLDLSEDELKQAAKAARVKVNGVIDLLLDPSVEPSNCNKKAKDIIAESHNNFYRGVSFEEVKRWHAQGEEKHPLNSTVYKNNNHLRERVWRAGNDSTSAGMYAQELYHVNACLRRALKYASLKQKRAIEFLINYFETGDLKSFEKFNTAWVYCNSKVDFILGFIEVYLDPRGSKGRYEGLVYFDDPETTEMMSKLGREAEYFEFRMPWDDKYKNPSIKPLSLKVVNVIFGCGDAGPLMPIGVNLPNDEKIRENHGSKSIVLKNVIDAYWGLSQKKLLREFAWDKDEIALEEKWGRLEADMHTTMHEVLGHASGRVVSGKDPHAALPGYYSTLEETRADLVALWLFLDPKLEELGVVSDKEALAQVAYRSYIRNGAMTQLRLVPEANVLEQDHMRNRQLIAHYLLDKSDVVEMKKKNGKTYFCVNDIFKMRETIGELLAEVMRIKAEGDFEAGRNLVEKYGVEINKELQKEVLARVKPLDIPSLTAFVMPELDLENDSVDSVEIKHPMELEAQMRAFGDL